MLYPSPYNIIVPDGDEILLFNTHTLSFGRLHSSRYVDAIKLVESLNNGKTLSVFDDELKHVAFEMRQKGFFVSDLDEAKKELTERFTRRKNRSQHLGLTIAPSVNCNFSCPYCYEYSECTTMSGEIQRNVAAYIKKELSSACYKSMHVTWYGGEPLLPDCFEAIEYLSEQIISACKKYDISYTSNIITNGYLLDREKAKHLVEWKVALAQVTLDGPKSFHDRSRIHKNGKGTFDRIIGNIKASSDLLRFSIRMNVNEENAASIMELKKILHEEKLLDNKGRVAFYVSPVRSYTSSCQSRDCLSNSSFYKLQLELLKNGINSDGFHVVEEYPTLKESVCTAIASDSYVIGASGELYKCWLDLGRHELSVGQIGREGIEFNERIEKWDDFMPFDEGTECLSCSMLPVCMGGCPELNMRSRNQQENQACCNWKYFLSEHLRFIANAQNLPDDSLSGFTNKR
ncbi:SPASM domain-containing protein [Chlorobium sp. BLA1]|nr:SPASM domain-containing protein [Candidatus Chlorobium masyuteum]NTV93007.1 SPASM domain-containing protein [Chlorobiaceae bacterium]